VELQIGCYEDSMLGVNHAMHDVLNAAGAHVSFQQFHGGHDWLCWHSELLSGLKRLFSVI
jgi:enterochelin esterase family protein